jgi:hypothetical protein
MKVMRKQTIQFVNDFTLKTGGTIKEGTVLKVRIRCHHVEDKEVADIIFDEVLEDGSYKKWEKGRLAPAVSCNDFFFYEE